MAPRTMAAKAVVRAPSSMSIRISATGSLPVCSREPIVDGSSVYRVHAEADHHLRRMWWPR